MSRIIKLPDWVTNRIAAGEVVERPSSVVKELVENSIDANATYIEIVLRNGGKEFIQITDDGDGMSPDDVLMSIQRHATSKIRDADDLESITTMGFRGEALPSIASVSLTEIVSRTADSDVGFKVLVDNGEIIEQYEIGTSKGTTVTVSGLFDKIPARKRFLKSDKSELARCSLWITRLALANPQISFRVESDGKETFYTPAVGTYLERIEQIFGSEFSEQLPPIEYNSGEYSIYGFVGNRTMHRARATDQYFFLNRRAIKSALISGALKRAFVNLIPPRRHPVAFIFIECSPDFVDVNVHPAKIEVRFRREDSVFGAVYRAVSNAIGTKPLPASQPSPQLDMVSPVDSQPTRLDFPQPKRKLPGVKMRPNAPERQLEAIVNRIIDSTREQQYSQDSSQPKFLQILNTYIVTATIDGILILDQHAAHERVLYEKVMESLEVESSLGQRLLFPFDVFLPTHLMPTLTSFLKKFADIGFEIEIVSSDKVRILSVPSFVRNQNYGRLLLDIMKELSEGEKTPDITKNFAASIACHSAIKAGQILTQEDMESLFDALFACDDPLHCPHGRPTIIKFSKQQLEKMFARHL